MWTLVRNSIIILALNHINNPEDMQEEKNAKAHLFFYTVDDL